MEGGTGMTDADYQQERPVGVIILAVLYVINAVVYFIMGGWLASLGALEIGFLGVMCVAPWFILGILFLVIGLGIYGLKTWAWLLALIFAILGLLGALANLASLGSISGDDVDVPGFFMAIPAVSLVLNIIIIVYLIKVKPHFR